jgi:hypothetical protein
MQVANVAPAELLPLVKEDQYHLILTSQLRKYPYYAGFYRGCIERGDFVILDNDAYEASSGTSSSPEAILQAIQLLGAAPSEIVLPDVMFGKNCAQRTIEVAEEGHDVLWSHGYRNFMAVPHGNTQLEWLECAMALAGLSGVKSLGIAEKDALKLTRGDRGELVRAIDGLGKEIHLLGMMEDMADIQDPWVRRRIRGVDGSKLIVWGLNGRVATVGDIPIYPGRPEGFFEISGCNLSDNQVELIQSNVNYWKSYVSSKPATADFINTL